MKNQINIAELLKYCPSGMELNCLMYEDVYFDYVDTLNIIHCYIQHKAHKTYLMFNQHGTPDDDIKSKCVIYPKGKTTWEGFAPPYEFKDGDILFAKSVYDWIFIYKESGNDVYLYKYVSISHNCPYKFITYDDNPICRKKEVSEIRLATEEEKQKLFDAIKENGYKWNPETKTLEKLVKPKFIIGDVIQDKDGYKVRITDVSIEDECYGYVSLTVNGIGGISFNRQDDWELVPDKFDVTTLKPFDKVLVRRNEDKNWRCSFFSHMDEDLHIHCYKYVTIGGKSYPLCIPYEGNEHLHRTIEDCDEYYKIWE